MRVQSVGSHQEQGAREDMQDFLIRNDHAIDGTQYFGVFDGHGELGANVASLTAQIVDEPTKYEQYHSVAAKAERAAGLFAEVTERLSENDGPGVYSGTTATVAFVKRNKLAVAYLGDSEAFYYQEDGKVLALTRPHDVTNAAEVARVEELGYGIYKRVYFGNLLALSRSVGNTAFPFVSHEAEITKLRLKVPGTLVVASDGVWGRESTKQQIHREIMASKSLRQSSKLAEYLVQNYGPVNTDNAAAHAVRIG